MLAGCPGGVCGHSPAVPRPWGKAPKDAEESGLCLILHWGASAASPGEARGGSWGSRGLRQPKGLGIPNPDRLRLSLAVGEGTFVPRQPGCGQSWQGWHAGTPGQPLTTGSVPRALPSRSHAVQGLCSLSPDAAPRCALFPPATQPWGCRSTCKGLCRQTPPPRGSAAGAEPPPAAPAVTRSLLRAGRAAMGPAETGCAFIHVPVHPSIHPSMPLSIPASICPCPHPSQHPFLHAPILPRYPRDGHHQRDPSSRCGWSRGAVEDLISAPPNLPIPGSAGLSRAGECGSLRWDWPPGETCSLARALVMGPNGSSTAKHWEGGAAALWGLPPLMAGGEGGCSGPLAPGTPTVNPHGAKQWGGGLLHPLPRGTRRDPRTPPHLLAVGRETLGRGPGPQGSQAPGEVQGGVQSVSPLLASSQMVFKDKLLPPSS